MGHVMSQEQKEQSIDPFPWGKPLPLEGASKSCRKGKVFKVGGTGKS